MMRQTFLKITTTAASLACATALATSATMLAPATAEARPSTKNFTCTGVRSFIGKRGAVVMNTKNRYVYRRLVASRFYCDQSEVLEYYYTPTKSGQCSVRICEDYLSGINFRIGR